VSEARVDPDALARYLRQRQELGHDPLFFERLSRRDALAALAGSARPTPTSSRPERVASVTTRESAGAGSVARGRPASSEAGGGGAPAGPPSTSGLQGDLEALRAEALACTRCRLCTGRTQAVFSDGNPSARLMVVGEAPGEREDQTGLPFVGPAGKLLDLMLASVGLSRKESVYICNVIKCRPPGNRNPAPDEIEACAPFLRRQIELIEPEALLAVGSFSGQLLTRSDKPLGKLRGAVYSYEGVPLVVTYHPAALLRNPGWSRAAWDDLQLLRQVMDG
jgi:DNA polymerase